MYAGSRAEPFPQCSCACPPLLAPTCSCPPPPYQGDPPNPDTDWDSAVPVRVRVEAQNSMNNRY